LIASSRLSTLLSICETWSTSARSLVIIAAITLRSMTSTWSPMCSVSRAASASASEGVSSALSSR
jgi:hypothetical protein